MTGTLSLESRYQEKLMHKTLIYSAHAHSRGGRGGHVETRNNVSFELEMPKIPSGVSRTGATTPEDLFAAGYASCFGSALQAVADHNKMPLKSADVGLTVTLSKFDDGGFGLEGEFTIATRGIDQKTAEELVAKAHATCPYSKATRGNIHIGFKVTAE